MKKAALLNFFFILAFLATGQNTTPNDFCSEIKKVVADTTSQYFYPLLLEKVKNTPENIDENDCYYLYYGKIFQPNHKSVSIFFNLERKEFDISATKGKEKLYFEDLLDF